jgi:hypothetical protein
VGCEPVLFVAAPATCPVALRARIRPCRLPTGSPFRCPIEAIGLDVHLEFCEVAVCENGGVRSAGRVESKPEALEVLAASLLATDRVALEVTGNSWEIVRILEPHVARVIVVSPGDTGSRTRAKTDRLDARAFCAGGCRVVSSWSAQGRGARTRSTRC